MRAWALFLALAGGAPMPVTVMVESCQFRLSAGDASTLATEKTSTAAMTANRETSLENLFITSTSFLGT